MSSRADTILRIARAAGAQTVSWGIGLLRVVWNMQVSGRWRPVAVHMDIAEAWIIGAAMDKTFAPAQKNLCHSQCQLAPAATALQASPDRGSPARTSAGS